MKYNKDTTSSRRKNRKTHLTAPSHARRLIMVAPLSKDLKSKHECMTLPIRKDDEVQIVRGAHKGAEGKVVGVRRKGFAIHIDRVTRDKVNGATVHIPVHPSNVVITSIKMDKDRKNMIERRSRGTKAHKASKESNASS
ncbi:60S ribosomal protein L26 [Tulasnella sp. 417]|nr:60S ribosomal protein L26 [Tulasnella sp. 417]